jgi:type IV pilus assembly protein PilA
MLCKFHKNKKGFTLIELMIVVVIIGILAALAIPRFMRSTTKAKMSEARQLLKQIYTMQRAYRQENDLYTCNGITANAGNPNGFAEIGVEVGASARYDYAMVATDVTFLCTATANLDDDDVIDTWTMDETGALIHTIDDSVL